jgi:Spy/CpxP family protein refolding chaperone
MKTFNKAKLAGAFAIALATATTMAFAATPAAASQYHEYDGQHRDGRQFDRHFDGRGQHRDFWFFKHHDRDHRHGFWNGHR